MAKMVSAESDGSESKSLNTEALRAANMTGKLVVTSPVGRRGYNIRICASQFALVKLAQVVNLKGCVT